MNEAVSCGGVVIYRGKILLLFKKYHDRYNGWVLPKGTVEPGEDFKNTAVREVKEELNIIPEIIRPLWLVQNFFKEKPTNLSLQVGLCINIDR